MIGSRSFPEPSGTGPRPPASLKYRFAILRATVVTDSQQGRSIVASQKQPVAVPHQCPSCRLPQTKIKRVLDGGKFGSSNFVCARLDCALGIDVSKLKTWVRD